MLGALAGENLLHGLHLKDEKVQGDLDYECHKVLNYGHHSFKEPVLLLVGDAPENGSQQKARNVNNDVPDGRAIDFHLRDI